MKKSIILVFVVAFGIALNSYSQSSNITIGIKAGANYSKYTPDLEFRGMDYVQYKRKFGFYGGGYLRVGVANKLFFQPELLFALQGTDLLIEDVEVTNVSGEINVSDFRTQINELTLAIPLVLRYYIKEQFFFDGGLQIGYIINRKETVKEDPFAGFGDPVEPMEFDYDSLDVGLTLGVGYNLSQDLALNGRFLFGIVERDRAVKTSVFNLGLEYNLL